MRKYICFTLFVLGGGLTSRPAFTQSTNLLMTRCDAVAKYVKLVALEKSQGVPLATARTLPVRFEAEMVLPAHGAGDQMLTRLVEAIYAPPRNSRMTPAEWSYGLDIPCLKALSPWATHDARPVTNSAKDCTRIGQVFKTTAEDRQRGVSLQNVSTSNVSHYRGMSPSTEDIRGMMISEMVAGDVYHARQPVRTPTEWSALAVRLCMTFSNFDWLTNKQE